MRVISLRYEAVRLLVLDLIGRAGIISRREIFQKIVDLTTEKYARQISSAVVREVLEELAEERLVRVLQANVQDPQRFSLTVDGRQELTDATMQVDALVDGLLANRKLFPSRGSEASSRGS